MRRIFTILIAMATLVMVCGVGTAEASPPATLHLTAFSVAIEGPSTNPVTWSCTQIHSGSVCGDATISMTINGFDAYGGIDGCLPWATTCTPNPAWQYTQYGYAVGGSAQLLEVYRCGTSRRLHVANVVLPQLIEWGGYPSGVNATTRVDSNTATVESALIFPSPLSYSACPYETYLLAAFLHNFVLKFAGQNGAPDKTWNRPAYHPVPLPS